jgi:hypothetical protein
LPRVIALPDHVEVRLVPLELLGVIALVQPDAEVPKLVAHRRIDLGVAAGDDVAALRRDLREAAHEGPADSENMKMHAYLKMKYTAPSRHNPAQT